MSKTTARSHGIYLKNVKEKGKGERLLLTC